MLWLSVDICGLVMMMVCGWEEMCVWCNLITICAVIVRIFGMYVLDVCCGVGLGGDGWLRGY